MKYRHHFTTGISLLVLLLNWGVLASDVRAQQRGDELTPQEFTEQEVLRKGITSHNFAVLVALG